MKKEDINTLAFNAFNAALEHIQKQMGIEVGDNASHFFSDDLNCQDAERTIGLLEDYIKFEYDLSEKEPTL